MFSDVASLGLSSAMKRLLPGSRTGQSSAPFSTTSPCNLPGLGCFSLGYPHASLHPGFQCRASKPRALAAQCTVPVPGSASQISQMHKAWFPIFPQGLGFILSLLKFLLILCAHVHVSLCPYDRKLPGDKSYFYFIFFIYLASQAVLKGLEPVQGYLSME